MLLAITAIVLTIILVIGIHEAGHALAARIFKVKIKKISIGFGKPLLRWQTASGCEWVWAFFPLGGYVQLENTRISPIDTCEYPVCFDKKPIWQRIIILLAGVIANLMTGWLALVFVYLLGLNYTTPQIQSIELGSRAAQADMIAGDRFVAIDGQATPTWNDVGMKLVTFWGKKEVPVQLISNPGKQLKEATLDLSNIEFSKGKLNLLKWLGIEPDLSAAKGTLRASSWIDAIQRANQTIATLIYFFLMIFKQLFSGAIPFSMLLGPLSVFAVSVASLTQGMAVFLFFIASLSLAVALVNLFPIPGLDGGSIVYAVIEKIRDKPVSVGMELLIHRLVFIVFCVLLVHLLMNDLQ